uniref:Uncharacterized protein ycf20 n=1 Tax=Caloglossa beccarii TaxID=131038 RepID=A0A1Z1M8C0_9FLOR|nr:hypothetical protein [Caloglossa beccarii]ARW62246.1 hypothetical protein [Caloglossa beccarii]
MIIFLIIKKIIQKFTTNKFIFFSLNIISLIFGFFFASILSTLPSQTGEWGIVNAAIIITINEFISKIFYRIKKHENKYLKLINNIRIGIIYGLFVDAFKLGS